MKFNIGFGIVLKNVTTSEHRHYYVSTNHLLFNRAKTINTSNVNAIMKDFVVSLFPLQGAVLDYGKSILDLQMNKNYKKPS